MFKIKQLKNNESFLLGKSIKKERGFIMKKVNANVAKVYSNDQKLWLNMSKDDASKQGNTTLQIFNYADKNGDKKISKEELDRYNSPVIIRNNNDEGASRIIMQGRVRNESMFGRNVKNSKSSIVAKNSEEEFYVGLELKNVSKEGQKFFSLLDENHDNKLSATEMKNAVEIRDKMRKVGLYIEKEITKFKNELNAKVNKRVKTGAILGGIGGTLLCGHAILTGGSVTTLTLAAGCALSGVALAGIGICAGFGALVGYFTTQSYARFDARGVDVELSDKMKSLLAADNMKKMFAKELGSLKNHPLAKYLIEKSIPQIDS